MDVSNLELEQMLHDGRGRASVVKLLAEKELNERKGIALDSGDSENILDWNKIAKSENLKLDLYNFFSVMASHAGYNNAWSVIWSEATQDFERRAKT